MVGPVIFDTVKRYLTYSATRSPSSSTSPTSTTSSSSRRPSRTPPSRNWPRRITADYRREPASGSTSPASTRCRGRRITSRDIIEIIQGLIAKGFAYPAGGDVYFDVTRDNDYGKLCNRDPEQLEAGARIEVSDKKRNPGDFALWKAAKPGEPAWDSPWGKGRPGWHIECSAMSMKLLGKTLDIHGGGLDLQFPHHENELAQSESYTGVPVRQVLDAQRADAHSLAGEQNQGRLTGGEWPG